MKNFVSAFQMSQDYRSQGSLFVFQNQKVAHSVSQSLQISFVANFVFSLLGICLKIRFPGRGMASGRQWNKHNNECLLPLVSGLKNDLTTNVSCLDGQWIDDHRKSKLFGNLVEILRFLNFVENGTFPTISNL